VGMSAFPTTTGVPHDIDVTRRVLSTEGTSKGVPPEVTAAHDVPGSCHRPRGTSCETAPSASHPQQAFSSLGSLSRAVPPPRPAVKPRAMSRSRSGRGRLPPRPSGRPSSTSTKSPTPGSRSSSKASSRPSTTRSWRPVSRGAMDRTSPCSARTAASSRRSSRSRSCRSTTSSTDSISSIRPCCGQLRARTTGRPMASRSRTRRCRCSTTRPCSTRWVSRSPPTGTSSSTCRRPC
jgi:hypothetical protein